MTVPEDEIPHLSSVLTLLGGKVVHGQGEYDKLAPVLPPPMPDWSPVRTFGGYQDRSRGHAAPWPRPAAAPAAATSTATTTRPAYTREAPPADARSFWGAMGCGCWAV
jgi:hypothetical protein